MHEGRSSKLYSVSCRDLATGPISATTDRDTSGLWTAESAAHIRARTANARTITDDNMGTECSNFMRVSQGRMPQETPVRSNK